MFARHAPAVARAVAVLTLTVVAVVSWSAPGGAAPGSTGAQRYIVVLDDSVGSPAAVARQQTLRLGALLGPVFSHALNGYVAELTPAAVDRLRADPRVTAVEPDTWVHISDQQVPTGVRRIFADDNPVLDIDSQDDVRVDVDVAVIDTGVTRHPDLNVVARADCSLGICLSGFGMDDNGHGTHVAGTIGALDNGVGVVGVAPGARIHSVKVCLATGSCLSSALVAGIDYVTARAGTIEVANMSLGGAGTSTAVANAITRSVNAGVVYAVAAGNDAADASGFFPANHPDVITVSALADSDGEPGGVGGNPACRPQSHDDALADFSNFGATVEVAAPGVCILSTWNDGGLNTLSGTSMATPHVTGAAAILAAGTGDPTNRADVLAIRQQIVAAGNLGWTDTSGDGLQEPLLDAHGLA